jgi:hypothetical protein
MARVVDVVMLTSDGRIVILPRYVEPVRRYGVASKPASLYIALGNCRSRCKKTKAKH